MQKQCKNMLYHGVFCQNVHNYAKAPFMNLNNAKTCKNTQYFDTNHAKAHLVDAKSCKSSHSFDTKCTNHAKSCKSNAKSCKSTLFLIVALLLFLIKVQNYAKAPLMNLNNAKAPSFGAKTLVVLIQIM